MDEILSVLIATRPEFAHPRSCRQKLVGPMRRFLVKHDGKELAGTPSLPPHAARLIEKRIAAAAELADFCARCGRCEEARILECGMGPARG